MGNKYMLFIFFTSFLGFSQNLTEQIKVGDTFKIASLDSNDYEAIQFPKANTIIKKGGIYSYDNIKNEIVEITNLKTTDEGKTIATIKRISKGMFFNSHKYLKVDIEMAIEKGELIKTS